MWSQADTSHLREGSFISDMRMSTLTASGEIPASIGLLTSWLYNSEKQLLIFDLSALFGQCSWWEQELG